MVKFYVTNLFEDKAGKLITAGQTIIISEDRAENLTKKNLGYVIGKAEEKDEKNKNLIGKK